MLLDSLLQFSCLAFVAVVPVVAQDFSPHSMWSMDEVPHLPPCIIGCFQWSACCCGCCMEDQIGKALECGVCGPVLNDCFCRTDKRPIANSYISSCIKSHCTKGDYKIDLWSASSIYNGYCGAIGYVATATTTVINTAPPVATTAVNNTVPPPETLFSPTATVTVDIPLASTSKAVRFSEFRFPLAGLVNPLSPLIDVIICQ